MAITDERWCPVLPNTGQLANAILAIGAAISRQVNFQRQLFIDTWSWVDFDSNHFQPKTIKSIESKQYGLLAFNANTQHNKISKAQKASPLETIVKNPSGHYSLDKNWSRIHLAKQKKINLPYSRKEMVDSLCAKWNSMRESSPDHNQLSLEQFRDLARTETDDELFRDCCNSAKKEGITLSEFMTRYV